MKKNFTVSIFYSVSALVLSVLAAFFGIVLYGNYIDEKYGLFVAKTNVPLFFIVFVLLCILFFCTSVFLFKQKKMSVELYEKNGIITAGAVLAGLMLAGYSGYSLYESLVADKSSILFSGIQLLIYRIESVGSVFGLLAAIYYIIAAFSGKSSSKVLALFSFFPPLWTVIRVMTIYFDNSVLLNNPTSVLHEISLVFLVFFQLSESRFRIKRANPILYFLTSLCAILMMATWTVPRIYFLGTGKIEFSFNAMGLFAELFLIVYIFGRVLAYSFDCKYAVKVVENRFEDEQVDDENGEVYEDELPDDSQNDDKSQEDYENYNDYFLRGVDNEVEDSEQLSFDEIVEEPVAEEIPLAPIDEPVVTSAESEAIPDLKEQIENTTEVNVQNESEEYREQPISEDATEVSVQIEDLPETVNEEISEQTEEKYEYVAPTPVQTEEVSNIKEPSSFERDKRRAENRGKTRTAENSS